MIINGIAVYSAAKTAFRAKNRDAEQEKYEISRLIEERCQRGSQAWYINKYDIARIIKRQLKKDPLTPSERAGLESDYRKIRHDVEKAIKENGQNLTWDDIGDYFK